MDWLVVCVFLGLGSFFFWVVRSSVRSFGSLGSIWRLVFRVAVFVVLCCWRPRVSPSYLGRCCTRPLCFARAVLRVLARRASVRLFLVACFCPCPLCARQCCGFLSISVTLETILGRGDERAQAPSLMLLSPSKHFIRASLLKGEAIAGGAAGADVRLVPFSNIPSIGEEKNGVMSLGGRL